MRDKEKGGKIFASKVVDKEIIKKYKEGQEKFFSSNSPSRGRTIWDLYSQNLAKEEVIKGLEYEKLTIARMAHDYQNEVIRGLEMIKSEREKEQQENNDEKEAFFKTIEKKEKEINEKNKEIIRKDSELTEANKKSETVKSKLQDLVKKQAEQEKKEAEALGIA